MPYRDRLPVIELEVATPCAARWDEMTGDDRVRHCRHCNRNVYNIESLTRREVEDLFDANEQRACIRYFQRHDGTVLARDCTDGIRVRMRPEQMLLWVMLILVGSVGLTLAAMECVPGRSFGAGMRVVTHHSATA